MKNLLASLPVFDTANEGTPGAPWSGASEGPWTVGEGDKAVPWFQTIPEQDVRDLMTAKAYKNPHELALAYHSLNKMQNGAGDVVMIPGENATPEQIKAFNTKWGVPESADKYDIKVPEGTQVDADLLTWGKGLSHKLGLNAKQAQTLVDEWNTMIGGRNGKALEDEQAANATAVTALETKWKTAGKDLTAEKAAGLAALKSLGPDAAGVVEKVEAAIGTAPVVELLALIGGRTKEGSFGPGAGGGNDPSNPDNMTPQQANAEVTKLYSDATFMTSYNDRNHPGHQAAVQKMLALQMKAASAA